MNTPAWYRPVAGAFDKMQRDRRTERTKFYAREVPPGADKYQQYIASYLWWKRRQFVFYWANWKCARCDGEATEVHHLTYSRLGHERMEDMEPLCHECHCKVHGKEAGAWSHWSMRPVFLAAAKRYNLQLGAKK